LPNYHGFRFFTQINIFWYIIIYWTPGRKT
jgi:hypothetical protein